MFALVNDGGSDQDSIDPFAAERLLCHRAFLCNLLTSGLALALLAGAEFRDSKVSILTHTNESSNYLTEQVLSFVYESRSRLANDFISTPVRDACSTAARVLEEKAEYVALVSSPTSIEPLQTLRALATEDVVLKVASLARLPGARMRALFFAFLIHLVLLPRLSTQDRARSLEPMKTEFKLQLESDFLPNIFRAIEVAITSLNTTIDIDMSVFIGLIRFLAENNTLSVQDTFGNEVTKIVQDKLSSFSVPISAFSQFAAEFLPSRALASPLTESRPGLLPFSNKIFDDELAPILSVIDDDGAGIHRVDETEEDEEVESDEGSDTDEWDASSEEEETTAPKPPPEVPRTGYFDDGTLFNDTRHWHNHKKPLLPKHLGGEAPPANTTEWQRKKKLRADQRFMKTLHDQAATLTGASGAALHQIKIPPVRAASKQPPSKVTAFA
jgi:hypothetical protein